MTGVLLKAVTAGRPRQVRLLLDCGIHIDSTDECGQTPLIRSVFLDNRRARSRIMRMLLKGGARVSKTDIVGRNAVMWGCIYSREKEVRWLINCSDVYLDLNYSDYNGQTALYHAVTSGNAATVKLLVDGLLKYGLSIELPDREGVTPLMQGIKLGHDVCCSILIQQGGATVGRNMFTAADVEMASKVWSGDSVCIRRVCGANNTDDDSQILGLGGLGSPGKNILIGYRREPGYFPPIVPQSCVKTIKRYEEHAQRQRVVTPSTASCGSLDRESTCGSESSKATDDSLHKFGVSLPDLGPTIGWTNIDPPPTIDSLATTVSQYAACARATSLTSSEEATVDSSDDEVDDRSRPVVEGCKGGFQPTRDLHRMYRVYEQQKCAAYRPGAARPVQRSDGSGEESDPDTSPSVTGGGEYGPDALKPATTVTVTEKNAQRRMDRARRAKTLTRRAMTLTRLPSKARLVATHAAKSRGSELTSSSESDLSEKLFVPTKKNVLPKIFAKGHHDIEV